MTVLSVRDLTVTYRTRGGEVPAVRGVSFDIGRGEVLGMAGESGCGKSTIVNAAMRLLPGGTTVGGQVLLDGEDVLGMTPGRLRAVRLRAGRGLQPQAASQMTVLSVRDLTVTYHTRGGEVPAVRGVSFDIGRGEVLGMAGESGCGKSTIVNAAMRLLPRGTTVGGQVLLDGEDVLGMTPGRLRAVRWAGASVIFQGALHALNPVRAIGEQIEEAMAVHGIADGAGASRRTGELLEQVGLPARRARDYPHELSGGQKQRVMIAMALACDPKVVIADEPTTALDVVVQAQVLRLLKDLQDRLGLAMLFITHDLAVLVEVCDRLAVMYAGSIVEEGPAGAVFREPAHPYTRALAAAYPTIGDARFRMAPSGLGGDPPQPEAVPSGCAFHPRCPVAEEACSTSVPRSVPAGPGRSAACLLVGRTGATGG